MEISSFPFLNQEDFSSSSSLFGLLQDFEPTDFGSNVSAKRRKTNDFFVKTQVEAEELELADSDPMNNPSASLQDILSKLLGYENERQMSSPDQSWTLNPSPVENVPFHSFLGSSPDNQTTQVIGENESIAEPIQPSINNVNKRSRADAATTSDESGGRAGQSQRRLWVKNRSKAWWELCNSPDFPDEEFKKAFRMSRATFDMICEELEPVVTKKDTMLRLAIPVRQRVAVCIWRLATGEPLREVSKRFGLGISTCHKLVLEVCTAIRTVLMPKFLQWPVKDSKMREVKEKFELLSGIPDVCGSMYTTHVPIIAPKVSVAAYFNKRHTERNQKTSYSVTVQGVVDTKGIFTDVCIGWPGSMPDDKILEKSNLFQRASRGLLKDSWVVGNSGYPLMDWVLTPYTHQNLTWTQHAFNEKIDEVQKVAIEAFMKLKARWSSLQKRTEVKLQDLPDVLGACCVLHNICEMNNEELSPELRFDLFDDPMVAEKSVRSISAVQARDQIAHKLLHHNLAGTNFL